LRIRRYAGRTDLQRIAEEVLGLSKMSWNTFDLYTKLPATLQSSTEIARIGALLQRFGAPPTIIGCLSRGRPRLQGGPLGCTLPFRSLRSLAKMAACGPSAPASREKSLCSLQP
jgi:hypothetical protein